jgi:hypothetical protein
MDHIGIHKHLGNLVAMSRQQFRVCLFDVAFPFLGQFDHGPEPRAEKATDHASSIAPTNGPANVQ